jgi:hypothetical protein
MAMYSVSLHKPLLLSSSLLLLQECRRLVCFTAADAIATVAAAAAADIAVLPVPNLIE